MFEVEPQDYRQILTILHAKPCCRYPRRLRLPRQAQEKDGNSGIKLTWKHPAAIELSRRVNSTDTRLHCHNIDKWIKIIRLWWLSQWLISHGRHPAVTIYSGGVSRLGFGFETCLETSFLESGSRRSQVSSRSRRISVSVSKDFSLGLELYVSRLCIDYFSWSFARRSSLKNGWWNDCSKFSRSIRSVAKFSLLLCCLRDGENNLPSTPFKNYTEFNNNVHAPMKLQRVISAKRGWEYFAKDCLWTVFSGVLLWNPQAYSTEMGNCESAKKFLCVMQTFLNLKMPGNSLEETFCS